MNIKKLSSNRIDPSSLTKEEMNFLKFIAERFVKQMFKELEK
jgi:hypothetical protein